MLLLQNACADMHGPLQLIRSPACHPREHSSTWELTATAEGLKNLKKSKQHIPAVPASIAAGRNCSAAQTASARQQQQEWKELMSRRYRVPQSLLFLAEAWLNTSTDST